MQDEELSQRFDCPVYSLVDRATKLHVQQKYSTMFHLPSLLMSPTTALVLSYIEEWHSIQ